MELPTLWQNAGHDFCGAFWFRRSVDIPAAWAGKDLLLGIGAVDKQDVTYFNGEQVGATGKLAEQQYFNVPRFYRVPGRLVKTGRNIVAVRSFSFIHDGGMTGPAAKMALRLAEQETSAMSLAGPWRYAIEHDL